MAMSHARAHDEAAREQAGDRVVAAPPQTSSSPPSRSKTFCKRGRSSLHFSEAAIPAAPPRHGSGIDWRSRYFKSSLDSCSGSAATFDWGSAFTERAVNAFRACPEFESSGVRHLCERLCYLRAYEPSRKWHALRASVTRAGAPTTVLIGWSVRMDGGQAPKDPWRISYVSPNGSVFPSAMPALAALGLARTGSHHPASPPSLRRKGLTASTSPQPRQSTARLPQPSKRRACGPAYLLQDKSAEAFPPSPFGLIEELLTDDSWKLLLGCIMLNQTTRSQMDPVLVRFLKRFPTAAATAAATIHEVTQVVAPLGLQERRPVAIIRFSQEYVRMEWKNPEELHWIGKYAADAHKIFIDRKWREVQPNDHALNWWVEWMRGTEADHESTEGSICRARIYPAESWG
eukprot:jgi/Undpi1/9118/HiC_scaffold_26.g11576.m1